MDFTPVFPQRTWFLDYKLTHCLWTDALSINKNELSKNFCQCKKDWKILYLPVSLDDAISVVHLCKPLLVGQTLDEAAHSGLFDTTELTDGYTTLCPLHNYMHKQ